MRLHIMAIGKLRGNDPKTDLVTDYLNRIEKTGRALGFSEFKIQTFEAPRGMTGKTAQARESTMILEAIPKGAHLILMDETGDNLSSIALSKHLETRRDAGTGMTVFAIGGANGHTDELRKRANKVISFGKATWPHMLARIMVCEQLYRAMTILSGHPYHRE